MTKLENRCANCGGKLGLCLPPPLGPALLLQCLQEQLPSENGKGPCVPEKVVWLLTSRREISARTILADVSDSFIRSIPTRFSVHTTVPRRRKRHPIAGLWITATFWWSDALIGNVRPTTSQMIAGRLDIAEAFRALRLKTKCRRKIRQSRQEKLKSFRNEWIHINLRPGLHPVWMTPA